jgi:hypothetical protein
MHPSCRSASTLTQHCAQDASKRLSGRGIRYFRFAHIAGLISSDPAVYARLPKVHRDESRTQGLCRLELIRFLQVAQSISVYHGALAYLLGINALRPSEAVAVRIGDYADTLRGYRVLHLVGKGNKPATMPLTVPSCAFWKPAAANALSSPWCCERSPASPSTAATPTAGGPDREGRWHPAAHQPHSLRHAAITNALDPAFPSATPRFAPVTPTREPPSTTTVPAATSTDTASTSSPPMSRASGPLRNDVRGFPFLDDFLDLSF